MKNHRRVLWMLAVLAALLGMVSPAGAMTINLTYDDLMLDGASSGTFNVGEKAVISQAVTQWQNSITSAGVVNITILKSALGGNLLGFADTYVTNLGDSDFDGDLNGVPISGRIRMDDRTGGGEVPFWVDPSPADNSEFNAGNTNYHFTSPGGGPAAGLYDMLSVVKHEIAHILGFSESFDNFDDGLTTSPLVPELGRWLYVFNAAPTLGPAFQYLPDPLNVVGGFPNGGVYMREYDEDPSGAGPRPSHVDWYTAPPGHPLAPPASGVGAVAGFFGDDLMNPALALGERTIESDVDLDILADAFGYTVIPEPATLCLLVLGGLLVLRRRSR